MHAINHITFLSHPLDSEDLECEYIFHEKHVRKRENVEG